MIINKILNIIGGFMEALREELIENYFADEEINDNFDYQNILSKIAFKLPLNEQMVLFPLLKIDDNKIILISDTHFGGINENYDYLKMVYEFASKYNYNYILHGGDLMQGDIQPLLNNSIRLSQQVKHVISNYPYDENIKNYVLLGNHDHFIYRNIENTLNILKERKDINMLGIKYAYINWYNHLISISHHLKKRKCKIDIPRIETLVKFHGHRHELHIIDSHVYLPTLSNDIKQYDGDNNYPGFLTAEIIDDYLNIYSYIFNDKKIVDKGLVLRREVNERVKLK